MRYECLNRHLSEYNPQTKAVGATIKKGAMIAASSICAGQMGLAQKLIAADPAFCAREQRGDPHLCRSG